MLMLREQHRWDARARAGSDFGVRTGAAHGCPLMRDRTEGASEADRVGDEEQLDATAALRLPASTLSAGRARRFVTEFCRATDLPREVCETAALLTSELVTNAIVHGRTSAVLEVHRPADTLRVAVRDDNPVLPPVGGHPG